MRSAQKTTWVPWNHGRTIGPKPPLKPNHIWAIRTRLQHEGRIRDLAMFNVAIQRARHLPHGSGYADRAVANGSSRAAVDRAIMSLRDSMAGCWTTGLR
jgi:hypothetical protein